MRKLKKFELDPDKTEDYFREQLSINHGLSKEVLHSVDFGKGYFYTLLPSESDQTRIYKFREGGILPRGRIIRYTVKGKTSIAEKINNLKKELSDLLNNELKTNHKLAFIFEDITSSPSSPYLNEVRPHLYVYNEKEVYYILSYPEVNLAKIERAVINTDAIWHFLIVGTTGGINDLEESILSDDKLREICIHAEKIIIGAYDGEGFLIWEKIA